MNIQYKIDQVTMSANSRASFSVTKNEQGEIISLSLNMNGDPYRWYSPNHNWRIIVTLPKLIMSKPYTGMF